MSVRLQNENILSPNFMRKRGSIGLLLASDGRSASNGIAETCELFNSSIGCVLVVCVVAIDLMNSI